MADIRIAVGVTGHRDLREEDRPILAERVKEELNQLKAAYPHAEIVMLNALAGGADQLCAACARELGIRLIAPLPRPAEEYRSDFSEEEAVLFDALAKEAEVFVAPATEAPPAEGDAAALRHFQFRQSGIYIASHCHVLIALWDGGEAKRGGCGSAECVAFALDGAYDPVDGRMTYTGDSEAVIRIAAPRQGKETCADGAAAGEVSYLGNHERLGEILRETEEFGRLAEEDGTPEDVHPLLPMHDREEWDPILHRLEKLYHRANSLSLASAKIYRRVLAALAVIGTVITLAFLLYDEAEAIWMILICGAMLLCAWGCRRYAVKSDCHRRYIEYRTLAECVRVQVYLRYAGSGAEAPRLMTWSQQVESTWVMRQVAAMAAGPAPTKRRDIRECWIEDQKDYHSRTEGKSRRAMAGNDRIVGIALFLSIAFYIAAVIFEVTVGGLTRTPLMEISNPDLWRTVLKLVLGTISAATLFTANYYGKQSLARTTSDHAKMAGFYDKMLGQIERNGQSEALLVRLAREELIENGNWSSYERDNTPDFSL